MLLLLAAVAAAQDLPADVAAARIAGKTQDGRVQYLWQIGKPAFYGYLVRYSGKNPSALLVLPDYMRQRMIQVEARKRNITVTDKDVARRKRRLDAQIRKETGGTRSLEQERKRNGMSVKEFDRRMRMIVIRERVARDEMNKRDPNRDKNKELEESTVVLVIGKMFRSMPQEFDRAKLPGHVVARLGKLDITVQQYGRELCFALPVTEMNRALNQLILVEEVKLLLGNDDPPTATENATQREWFLNYERNRLGRLAQSQGQSLPRISDDMIEQTLQKRGLTLELVFNNPGFLAQARARGHFLRTINDTKLKEFYEANKKLYGDKLKVARILVAARAQRIARAGTKVRNLQQGKALSDALWIRATQGEDFGKLAAKHSDDPDVICKLGGVVPFLVTAHTPGYEDTWIQANALKPNGVSKPFFSPGRGYVIVMLVERKEVLGFEGQRGKIRRDAAEQAYMIWRAKAIRKAVKSETLVDED